MADRDTYLNLARQWSEVANAPLKRQGHYDADTERASRLAASREAAKMYIQGAMTPDINETLPEDLADAMSAPRGLFMQRSSKSPNFPGYEGLAGFMAKDPDAWKSWLLGDVLGAVDILGGGRRQPPGWVEPSSYETTPVDLGADLRNMLGIEETPQSMVAEMATPTGAITAGFKALPLAAKALAALIAGGIGAKGLDVARGGDWFTKLADTMKAQEGMVSFHASKADRMDVIPEGATTTNIRDIFDERYIGDATKGEGATAKGWGFYFAERPGIAHTYRKQFSDYRIELDGQDITQSMVLDPNNPARDEPLLHIARLAFYDPRKRGLKGVREDAVAQINAFNESKFMDPMVGEYVREQQEIIDTLDRYGDRLKDREAVMFDVDIPDPVIDRMLDLDQPLSRQPDNVKDFFREWQVELEDYLEAQDLVADLGEYNGWELYQITARAFEDGVFPPLAEELTEAVSGKKGASLLLRDAGVPGNKFYDAASRHRPSQRGAGGFLADLKSLKDDRTRNFVLFSPDDIQEVKRNGKVIFSNKPNERTAALFQGNMFKEPTADQKLFIDLADAQRGEPEIAMLKAQNFLGGGDLSHALEHVGDLTHRMSERTALAGGDMGYDYVKNKLKSTRHINTIIGDKRYGYNANWGKWALQSIDSASDFRGMTRGLGFLEAQKRLQAYADAHKKLPVFNHPQRLARDASVALGEMRWKDAARSLDQLQDIVDLGKKNWIKVAGSLPQPMGMKAANAGAVPPGYLRFRHFGKHDVDTLKVEKFGTGIKGAEGARGSQPVISLYPDEGFTKEVGLGNHEYVIDIPMDQMYNANADPLGLKAKAQVSSGSFRLEDGKMVPIGTRLDMNKYEDLIRESGYFGYYTPDAQGNLKGQARVFHDIDIR